MAAFYTKNDLATQPSSANSKMWRATHSSLHSSTLEHTIHQQSIGRNILLTAGPYLLHECAKHPHKLPTGWEHIRSDNNLHVNKKPFTNHPTSLCVTLLKSQQCLIRWHCWETNVNRIYHESHIPAKLHTYCMHVEVGFLLSNSSSQLQNSIVVWDI